MPKKKEAAAAQPQDDGRCKNCGACKECGHRTVYVPMPYPVYPVYPQPYVRPSNPYSPSLPYITWGSGNTMTGGTYTQTWNTTGGSTQ